MSKANKRKASLGTKVAAEMRTKVNKLSDKERDASMSVAMQLIYGKSKAPRHAVRR